MSLPGGPWPPSADSHLLPVQALLKISVPAALCVHRQGQVRENTQTLAVQEANHCHIWEACLLGDFTVLSEFCIGLNTKGKLFTTTRQILFC